MKKFTFISIGILAVMLTILAIGDWDYTISSSIINESSIWANFFNMFGELPAFLALLFSSVVLMATRKKEIPWRNITGILFGSFFIVLFTFALLFMPIQYAFEHAVDGIPGGWMIFAVISVIIFASLIIYFVLKHEDRFQVPRKYALLLIFLVIGEIAIVNILKGIWARPRMRSIDDISQFKHWYEISGWTNDNELKSFPSGHTANAFVAISFMMLSSFYMKMKAKYVLAFGIVWGVLVAASRVVLGSHFLSDVVIGGYVTIFLFLALHKWIIKEDLTI